MPAQSESFDVAVVGGGAIGLACAWRAQQRGARVVVLDAGEPGAWNVAAGMLAPVSEAEFGERELLELGLESARRYADFCAELDDPGYRTTGTMVVARDRDEAEALDRLAAFRRRARPAGRAPASVAGASPRAGAGAHDPARARHRGRPLDRPAQARRRARAGRSPASSGAVVSRGCVSQGERVTGVELADGGSISAGAVVVAAGVHVAHLRHARTRARPGPPRQGPGAASARPERARPHRAHDPRRARLLRPARRRRATCSARRWRSAAGTRRRPPAASTSCCATSARSSPASSSSSIEELTAGLRPATPDNLPAIGHGALDGLIWATGHYRNGILLTPVTADLVAGMPGRRARAGLCRRGRPAPLRRSARMKVMLNGESAELVDGATVTTALGVARPAGRRPRRGGRRRRRGRPARAVGRDRTARGGAGGDPARDPGRLRWPSPTRTPTS